MRRELVPGTLRNSSWLWGFCAKFVQMLLLSHGLCLFFVTGFSLDVNDLLLYGGISLLCMLFTVFFYNNWLTGARIPGALALTLATTVTVLFTQADFLSGFSQLGRAVLVQMNERYNGDYMIPLVVSDPKALSIFFLLIFVPITACLGAFTVYRCDAMVVSFLLLPLLGLGLLVSATPAYISPVFLVLGFLSVSASGRIGWQKSLWGQKGSPQWHENLRRRKKISALSSLLICATSCILMIPSFWILMPSLSTPLSMATPIAQDLENYVAQGLLKGMTDLYGGTMSAPISTFGGGVTDGNLANTSGYLISGVEDLRLRINQKPQETIYLRGFIGSSYTTNQWIAPEESVFNTAAENWQTESDPALYLYNLPFLRMLYEQTESNGPASAQLTVERLNANGAYTYAPYGSYLNEYYQIQGGDGAITGQSIQDDSFVFYFRADQLQILKEEFFFQNESSLDQLERSYAAYAHSQYLHVPDGFEHLKSICSAAQLENTDTDTIIAFVQRYFWDNFTYSLTLPEISADQDATIYFLEESHVGCSPQFASAATIMFRILGIPARYVVGYAASESLFTPQPDGSYQAVLQSDNAHAWVEIYINGTGWLPIETTPGQLGLVQDIEYFGTDLTPEDVTPSTQVPDVTEPAIAETPSAPKTEWVWLLPCFIGLIILTLAVWLIHRIVEDFGLNRRLPPLRRLRLIFAAYFRLLRRAGLPPDIDSTSEEFPVWVTKLDPNLSEQNTSALMALILESCFAQRQVTETDVVWIRGIYLSARKSVRRIKEKQKL